jgi:hypothetical protein
MGDSLQAYVTKFMLIKALLHEKDAVLNRNCIFFVQFFLKAAPIHKSLDDFIIYDRVVYCIMTNSQKNGLT